MGYVTPIVEAGLSPKDKPLKHSRGRNFHWIVTKFHTHVGLIKIQILCENKLCGTNRSGNTFLQRKSFGTRLRS